MITADDYELAEAALLVSNGVFSQAVKLLRDECGWTLLRSINIIKLIQGAEGKQPEL